MNKQQSSDLLHYGKIISDTNNIVIDNGVYKENVRLRTILYNGKNFIHRMVNGEVVECFELK